MTNPEIIDEALIEASSYLSNSIGESVPLHDYRSSVEVFFAEALSRVARSPEGERAQGTNA